MKTEELLRREAEYRVIREAFETYHLDVVAARAAQAQDSAAEAPGISGHSIRCLTRPTKHSPARTPPCGAS